MDGVSKRYGGWLPGRGVWALREVSFALPAGSVLAVLGPNRAGKTTLVKVLLSLCRADGGRVLRLGRPATDRSTLARIGYLHESQAFPRYLSARELLTYYGALAGVGRYTLARRVNGLLERVGLADRAAEPIGRFSKGMMQRLALAQALVNDPALLVLDEPSEGMDLPARRMLHDVVRERRAAGHSVLLVSHCVGDVEQLCDLALVLRAGRIVFCGTREELAARSNARHLPGTPAWPQPDAPRQGAGEVAAAAAPAAPPPSGGALCAALEQLYAETVP
jgi:ABC-2 type transport system ATP-binding protein